MKHTDALEAKIAQLDTLKSSHAEESGKIELQLKWTQNKLQSESERVTELTEQLAKANNKIKEVGTSIVYLWA